MVINTNLNQESSIIPEGLILFSSGKLDAKADLIVYPTSFGYGMYEFQTTTIGANQKYNINIKPPFGYCIIGMEFLGYAMDAANYVRLNTWAKWTGNGGWDIYLENTKDEEVNITNSNLYIFVKKQGN